MKTINLGVAFVLAMTVQGAFAQNNRIIRRHNGAVSLYSTSEIQKAIDECEDGDTLSLGKGSFPGINIKKPITIVGNGVENTRIVGDVTVGTTDKNNYLNTENRLLDGVKIDGVLNIYLINNVRLRKCEINSVTNSNSYYFDKELTKVELENCNVLNQLGDNNFKNVTAINSKIGRISEYSSLLNSYFQNCYVKNVEFRYFDGYMSNCIIGCNDSWRSCDKGNWENCLFLFSKDRVNENVTTNCYFNEELSSETLTDDDMRNLPYKGDDGTVVGPYGGSLPYTLEKLNPITSVKLKVDDANQKLNVTVKLADK